MISTSKALGMSPEVRAGIFHFTVFGSTGVASVYFGIWLSNRGISPDEIGVINAIPVLLMLAVNLLVGRLCEKAWLSAAVFSLLGAALVAISLRLKAPRREGEKLGETAS